MNIYNFMKQLTKNIEYNLSGLLVEKHLYNFIRDFLYSPTKLLYISPYINGNLQSSIEIPITGSNYMIIFDETKLEQDKKNINLFNEINSDMGNPQEYIFEILGDFTSIDYIKTNPFDWLEYGSYTLKQIIDYGTNPELKTINLSKCKKVNIPEIIPDIENFICNKFIIEKI